MQGIKERNTIIVEKKVKQQEVCYHCGTECFTRDKVIGEKFFCCDGCMLVFEMINQSGLCDYYKLASHPGLSQVKSHRSEKYSYLDNESIAKQLYKFTDGNNTIITLYIPGVHCSSCMWLLEHLPRLDKGITESRLNFSAKEVTIHFLKEKISLRSLVELLTTIGYEPYISLEDTNKQKISDTGRQKIYKLGVAGFCFGNIMMLSFPEYLSGNNVIEQQYVNLFRALIFILALPVFFYSASEFFISAWRGLQQKMLNIDAPIVLALIITFGRSIYEIISGTGSGYLDSMSGIVFFMLAGRIVQERTYKSISFHRDYKSYFPIAVMVLNNGRTESKKIEDIKENEIVLLHHDEIIPGDGVVIKGQAKIDYSFVTGETVPVNAEVGEMVYAGGKQQGSEVTIEVLKPVAASYLTSLWNHHAFKQNKSEKNRKESVIHILSKYFTYILFTIAAITAAYWAFNDPSKILNSVSAMMIVACPCALLLSATYTNGNLLRIFSDNGLFIRDASVIEQLGNIKEVVFDKTGTLTKGTKHFKQEGPRLTAEERQWLFSVVSISQHPYSKALARYLNNTEKIVPDEWEEYPGKGIKARIGNKKIFVGSAEFTGATNQNDNSASLYAKINNKITCFHLQPDFRDGIGDVITNLRKDYNLSLLTGDNDKDRPRLRQLFGPASKLKFYQKPIDKLEFIVALQQKNDKVLMVGDGLNDAGALQQSNVGITLADDVNNFTPSCDAILDAGKFSQIPPLLKLARWGGKVINISFVISILYNLFGLAISMQGKMSPMIAAILMPASTLTIVLFTTGASNIIARHLGLALKKS
jgi:P-type Cu+ transporter